MKYPTYEEAANLIIDIGGRMYSKNFVAANDGNISCKISDDTILITPTNVSKGFMTKESLVKMHLDGTIISDNSKPSNDAQSNNKPSSESKLHLRVYNENPEVGGVTHAHPPHSTAYAVVGRTLNVPILAEAILFLGTVPCVPYELTGTQEMADAITPYCKDYCALLLANHGALTWGTTPLEAFFRLETLEHYARILMYAEGIGGMNLLDEGQVKDLVQLREKWAKK